MQVEYLLQSLNYTQTDILLIDLNEINLGSYLMTLKSYKRLLNKIKLHNFNLIKQIFTFFPRSITYDIEFTLILRIYNLHNKKRYTVHFGTLSTWEKGIGNWIKKYSMGKNLYAELIYILAFQKCAVK